MKLAKIVVRTDGGPWAEHNMPCPACRTNHAILDLHTGRFQPCGSCHRDGWRLAQRRRWVKPRGF